MADMRTIEQLFPIDWIAVGQLGLIDDVRGWNSDSQVFDQILRSVAPKTIVEVGSWKGRSAIRMGKLAPEARIYCVDTWMGGVDHIFSDGELDAIPRRLGYPQLYFQFFWNVYRANLQGRIQPIPNTSIAGAAILKRCSITADLAYIDASHEYTDVWLDLLAYWPLVRNGGIMFGDDWGFPGVQVAVLRFITELQLKFEVAENNFWIIRKA